MVCYLLYKNIFCLQVTEAMTEEIGRLGLLVNEFDHPFHPHPGFLRTYKKVRTTKKCTGIVICKGLLSLNLEAPNV